MKTLATRSFAMSAVFVVSLVGCNKSSSPDSAGAHADQAASGQAPGERHHGFNFDELDKNKDGKITQDEAGEAWKFLSKADTNGDGAVTREELQALHPHKKAE